MKAYTGEELNVIRERIDKEIINSAGCSYVRERDFVSAIRDNYFNSDMDKVLVVSGLRAMGKTVGLYQATKGLDDVIYITAEKGEDETGDDYIKLLKNTKEKYIVIDEYSWIKDRKELDYYLYTLVNNGKRVAITGTSSIALDYLNYSTLAHRVCYVNVNMFSYEEYCRVYQKPYNKESCENYLKNGGVFKEYAIDTFDSMINYLQTAVIENLADYSSGIDIEKAKAVVYDIMYLAVCGSDETKVKYPNSRKNDIEYQRMLARIGIDPSITFDSFDFERISDILIKTGFVVKTANLFNEEEYRLHLVNPSLTYQMVNTVFCEMSGEERLEKVFEACLVSFMSKNIRDTDYTYYADMGKKFGRPELELVVVNPDDHLVYLFEATMQEAASLSEKAKLVSDELADIFTAADVWGRFVVCNIQKEKCAEINAKKVIFTRLDCDTILNYRDFQKNYDNLEISEKAAMPLKNKQQ